MNRFILVIILLVIYYITNRSKKDDNRKRLTLIRSFSVFLILDSGLRHLAIGQDTYIYYMRFQEVKEMSLFSLINDWISSEYIKDPFYSVFQKIFQELFPHYRLFLFFVAILFFWSLGRFIYRNVPTGRQIVLSYIFYIGFYYGFFSITGIRQTIAVAIIMFAYDSISKKKLIPALILTVLAAQFHSSAWIFLIAFIIPYINIIKFRNIIIPLSIVLFILIFYLKNSLILYFIDVSGFEDYRQYVSFENSRFSLVIFSLYLFIFILIIIFWKELTNDIKLTRFTMMYIIAFMLLATMFIDNNAVRISYYFTISMYVLLPACIEKLNFKGRYTITIMLMLVLISFTVRDNDYGFYWQKMKIYEDYGTFYIQEYHFLD